MTLTPVGPLLRDVVSDLRRRHEDAEVTLRGAGGDARVALAENDLRSVVTNLIVNAIQATGGGARVAVSGERRRGHAHDQRGRPRPRAARGQRVRGLLHDQVERHGAGALARAPPGGGRRRQHHLRRTAGAAAPCSPCACRCRATSASAARASSSSRTTRRSATSRRRRSRSYGARVTAAVSGQECGTGVGELGLCSARLPPARHDRCRDRDAPGARDAGAPREQRPGRRSGPGRRARQARVVPAQTRRGRPLSSTSSHSCWGRNDATREE